MKPKYDGEGYSNRRFDELFERSSEPAPASCSAPELLKPMTSEKAQQPPPVNPAVGRGTDFVTQHRKDLLKDLDTIETWVSQIRMTVAKGDLNLFSTLMFLSDATRSALYEAGLLNGHHMAQFDKQNAEMGREGGETKL